MLRIKKRYKQSFTVYLSLHLSYNSFLHPGINGVVIGC